jgi:hypothetical protein
MGLFLDQPGVVAALEQVPDPTMVTVERARVAAVQMPHPAEQVRPWCFDQQVVVVVRGASGILCMHDQ